MPLGDHLLWPLTKKFSKEKYIDVFFIVFREQEKDKEDLMGRDKEGLKCHKVG